MYSTPSVTAAVCSVIFPILASLAVGLRFRARHSKKQELGRDDYVTLAALVFAIALCCIVFYGAVAGNIGRDLTELNDSQYENYFKRLYAIPICAYFAYGLAKIAIIEFYKRIFTIPKFKRTANIVMAMVIAWMIAAILGHTFSAWPISQFWTRGGKFTVKFGLETVILASGDLVQDIVILCLPIPIIRTLSMKKKDKLKLIGVLWLGIFCVIAVAVRLYFATEMRHFQGHDDVYNTRYSYVAVNTLIWAEIESCCSIIAGCLPFYGPLKYGARFFRPFYCVSSIFETIRRGNTQIAISGEESQSKATGGSTFKSSNLSRQDGTRDLELGLVGPPPQLPPQDAHLVSERSKLGFTVGESGRSFFVDDGDSENYRSGSVERLG